VSDISGTTTERLRALTVAYKDAEEVWERCRDKWQIAIRDAVDDIGMSPANVGGIVGVTAQRINAIIERVYRTLDT
jgi:hypothetical protein